MALASYCIASHCIPIISPINPSPLRRERQFYFCCFFSLPFALLLLRVSQCVSRCTQKFPLPRRYLDVTCNLNPAQNFQRNRSKGGGGKRKEKKKRKEQNIQQTNPPSLKKRTLTSHIHTYIPTYIHTVHTYIPYSNTEYSTVQPVLSTHPSPPYLPPIPIPIPSQRFQFPSFPKKKKRNKKDSLWTRQKTPIVEVGVYGFRLFLFSFLETGGGAKGV